MKKQIHMRLSLCILVMMLITFQGCGKTNQALNESPAVSENSTNVSSPEISEPATTEGVEAPAEFASNSKPEAQPPRENELLNIMGTAYQTGKSLIIITEAKSKKTVPEAENVPFNVTVRVSNKSQGNLNYTSWTPVGTDPKPDLKTAYIQDDKGNTYPIIPIKKDQAIEGQILQTELKPGEAVKDLLLFSELKPDTKRLRLFLPGSEFTDYKDLAFNFQLP